MHEAKNFPLQFGNGGSWAKVFGFVCDSPNLITSSGAWSKAHWINFPLISLRLLGKVFKRAVISAGGRLAGSLVWRLVLSETDMHKLDSFLLKKRMVSALWRETLFLPLTDLRFLPTLGAARSWQPHRWEAIGCSIAKRRAFVLLCVATTWGCSEQPRFCATGTNGEKNVFPLLASWEQQGWWKNEERHHIAKGRCRTGVQQGQIHVNGTSLVCCTSTASLQWYKAFMRLTLMPAKQCFCWKSLF